LGSFFPAFVRNRLHKLLRVSDQATGRVYYTDYDRTDSGAVIFEDAKTRSKVTFQSSEISEVSRQDFAAGRRK
jgi:hypothetical protein